jgi:hypothetical protein
MDDLHLWFHKTLAGLSRKSDTAAAIRYALSRWRAWPLPRPSFEIGVEPTTAFGAQSCDKLNCDSEQKKKMLDFWPWPPDRSSHRYKCYSAFSTISCGSPPFMSMKKKHRCQRR